MLRVVFGILVILICFISQSTVFSALALGGIVPNLLIIITASFGFMRGEKDGLVIGFFCGILTDVFYGGTLGFYGLIFMYIGYLNGKFSRMFYPEDIKLPLALIGISDFTYGLVCYVLLFLLHGRFHFWFYMTKLIIPEVIYTILVTLIVYPIVLKLNGKVEAFERRRAQKFV